MERTSVISIAPRPLVTDVRCECGRCGAHVIVRAALTIGGSCGNCGSYELTPVTVAPAPIPIPVPVAA